MPTVVRGLARYLLIKHPERTCLRRGHGLFLPLTSISTPKLCKKNLYERPACHRSMGRVKLPVKASNCVSIQAIWPNSKGFLTLSTFGQVASGVSSIGRACTEVEDRFSRNDSRFILVGSLVNSFMIFSMVFRQDENSRRDQERNG